METWKEVKGYEGVYMVSNLGRVKSLDRETINGKRKYMTKGRIKKQSINNAGYQVVNLSKNGKDRVVLVHRIVGDAFLDRVEEKYLINHKDGNKLNNNISNLEWSTYQENNKHAIDNGLNKVMKKIKGINLQTKEELIFESAREANRILNIDYRYISECCLGRQKTAYGYKWEFID